MLLFYTRRNSWHQAVKSPEDYCVVKFVLLPFLALNEIVETKLWDQSAKLLKTTVVHVAFLRSAKSLTPSCKKSWRILCCIIRTVAFFALNEIVETKLWDSRRLYSCALRCLFTLSEIDNTSLRNSWRLYCVVKRVLLLFYVQRKRGHQAERSPKSTVLWNVYCSPLTLNKITETKLRDSEECCKTCTVTPLPSIKSSKPNCETSEDYCVVKRVL